MTTKTSTVVSNQVYPLVLADGSQLSPGESREDVDMDAAENRALYFDGHLSIVSGFRPRTRGIDEEIDDPDVTVTEVSAEPDAKPRTTKSHGSREN